MDFGDKLGQVFENYIGRVVAFVLTPVLLTAAPPVANAVNEVLGTGYSDQQISNIAIAMCVGIALAAWQWLRNRGNWETKLAELHQLYEAGAQHVAQEAAAGNNSPDVPGSASMSSTPMDNPKPEGGLDKPGWEKK